MNNRSMLAGAVAAIALFALLGADTQPAPKIFKTNDDGFIQNWLILDPILLKDAGDHSEEVEKPMFEKENFKGDKAALPKADEKVKVDGKELQWHDTKIEGNQIDLAQFAADHQKDSDSALFFGVAYVIAPDDIKDVKIAIGSDDSSTWWVNDKEVIRVYTSRGVTEDDDVSKPLTLHKGINVVRFAVINGDGPSGACARFLDKDDKPVKNLTVTTVPPPAPATAPK